MTAQEVIDRAFSRSKRFLPNGTATPEELVPVVQDSLYALFQIAVRVNPDYFGADKVVEYTTPGWYRPSDAESVQLIERVGGGEVAVVSLNQRKAEPGKPSVYERGGIYRPAGVAAGPDPGESLTFFYSRSPAILVAPTSDIDPAFPESHRTLLELDVAIRMALKDGGPTADIVGALGAERRDALRRFVAFLEHETVGLHFTYGTRRRATEQSLVSLESLLAGGAA